MNRKLQQVAFAALFAALPLAGCTLKKEKAASMKSKSTLPQSGNPADQVGIPGVPGATLTTSKALALRISNGLKNQAVPTSGNFQTAMTRLAGNLPENTNPNRATGFDQVPLLAYAACTDINIATAYGIQNAGSTGNDALAQKSAIVAAAVNILDQHTGGLGSTGPLAAKAREVFEKLFDQNQAISGETVRMHFISQCVAASTFGAMMTGY